jgi:hypothetical protein
MQAYSRYFALIAAALTLGGILVVIMSVDRVNTDAQAATPGASTPTGAPPIDAAAPVDLETATFALG